MLTDIFVLLIPALVISLLVSSKRMQYLQLNKIGSFKMLLLGAITIVVSLPLINYLGVLNQLIPLPAYLQDMEQKADAIEAAFELHHTLYDLAMNLLVMALVAAICEEFFFRAGLQKILIKMTKNIHVAVWLTAIIFSAFHMQFSGFFPRMLLGVFLGYLFVWSGSIWVSIFAHFMFNATQIFVSYLQDIKASNSVVDNIYSSTPGYGIVIVSTVLVIFLLVVIYRIGGKKSVEVT
jgi:membrane protease YdiL (CAAX protease family)